MNKLHCIILALLSPSLSFAQPILHTPQQMACYDWYTGGFFVLPDSTSYWRYDLKHKKWQRYAMKTELDVTFKEFAENHNPLPIAPGKVYFVNRGCGTVYLLDNGVLRRVDASFAHKNQYEGMLYAYKGRPHMFGGYGFFQTKNVHSYYEPALGEWFELAEKNGPKPSARQAPFVLRENVNMYMVGGYQNSTTEKQEFLPEVWKFQVRSKTWTYLGAMSASVRKELSKMPLSSMQSSKLLAGGSRVLELDVLGNELRYYSRPSFVNTKRWLLSADRKYVLMLTEKNGQDGLRISVQPKNAFLGEPYKRSKLYIRPSWFERISYKDYLNASLLFNILLAGAWFYSKRSWQPIKFNFGSRKLRKEEFDAQEWLFLVKLQQDGEIELSAVSSYITEEGLSFDALKKRRETFLRNIRVKIALQTQIPLERVLPEGRHQLDKRMKMVCWNEELELG